MSELRRRLADLLERLAPRERALLAAAGAATTVVLLWLLVATLAERRAALGVQIAAAERDLDAMVDLRDRLLRMRAENEAVRARLAELGTDFSLFAHLEGVTRDTVTRERIAAMNPSTRTLADGTEEDSVEMQLAGVSLRELTALLYRVERGDVPLLVSRLRVKKRFDEPSLLDATLVIARLRPAA